MAQAIVNLALPVIKREVEKVLEGFSQVSQPKQSTSMPPHEELVTYVLRRMPTVYTTTENPQACSAKASIHCFSKEQRHQMEVLIYEGIHHLANRQSSWEAAAQGSTQGMEPSPSHWFG